MFAIFSIGQKLFEKLRKKSYRTGYVGEHVRRGIAYQIRALRDQRKLNQGAFSRLLDKPQSVVCRLEDPSYGKVTVQTLLEVAAAFDVALQVRFIPFSTFLQQTRDVSPSSMAVTSFDEELESHGHKLTFKPMSEIFATGNVPQIDFGPPDVPKKSVTETQAPTLVLQ